MRRRGDSRALARRGAQVTGVDGSGTLIAVARNRAAAAGLDIDYRQANASALDSLPPESFDLIVASMVMMNVEDYVGAVREAYRVLAPRGEIAMSITHPCFSAPVSDWVGGKGRRARHFAVDRYFERIAVARSHRLDVPDADAPPSSSARGLHDQRHRRRDSSFASFRNR
jgi:ubiquinone/menaquinone biosynthesis C-methylase UbiE